MPLDIFLQINLKIMGLMSGFFLCSGVLGMSSNSIAAISSTYYHYNEKLLGNLICQKFDFICGFIFLMASFVLDLGFICYPSAKDIFIPINKILSFVILTNFYLLLSCLIIRFRHLYVRKMSEKVEKCLETPAEGMLGG